MWTKETKGKNSFTLMGIFLSNARKINATIPVLILCSMWITGLPFSATVQEDTAIDSVPRAALAISTMVLSYLLLTYVSSVLEKSKSKIWFIKYVLTIASSYTPVFICWYFFFNQSFSASLIPFLRLTFVASLSESTFSYLVSQIKARAEELELHQASLVVSEEEFRQSVFNHLHDTLQSRLVSVGIMLGQIKNDLDAENELKLNSIIDEIETIRKVDVRDFGSSIVPLIETSGLTNSIQKLLKTHKRVIESTLEIDAQVEFSKLDEKTFGLGIYRIIEQALLNSMVHGGATEFKVRITATQFKIDLQISNNGKQINSESFIGGHGFAVIDSWVSKFGGKWQVVNGQGRVTIDVYLTRPILL